MKRLFYVFILFLPLLLLSFLLFSFISGILKIRKIDYAKMRSELQMYLGQEKGGLTALLKDGVMRINYDYYVKEGPYKKPDKEIPFNPLQDECLIYVFGSSVVGSKPPLLKDEVIYFPQLLEGLLNSGGSNKFKVYNFAMEGFDSFEVKELALKAFGQRKPDIAIYFDIGVGNFENSYYQCIKKKYYFFWNFLLSNPRLPRFLNIPADQFLREFLEPNLLNLCQKLKLIRIPLEPFLGFNGLILESEKRNILDIIRACQAKRIPLVIVMPMGNLEERPYGIYELTDYYYNKGMKEVDPYRRIDYLVKARDSEIFTFYFGFKKAVYDFLCGLREKGVYLLDLTDKSPYEMFDFSYDNFYDYGHMKTKTHRIVAEYLYDFLKKNILDKRNVG
ncbi:MAG: hypothetical protein AB1481_06355 [Candidatus Omnitrophota bacterium]